MIRGKVAGEINNELLHIIDIDPSVMEYNGENLE